jgi:siderophore synthetase component
VTVRQPSDPTADARVLHAHALLNCVVREGRDWDLTETDTGKELCITLPRGGSLHVGVAYESPTLRHRYHLPVLLDLGSGRRPVELELLAALLLDAVADDADTGSALRRILDSTTTMAASLAARADEVDRLWSAAPLTFADSEQALLVGHMVHPTPKSREEMDPDDRARFSPEWGAAFPLRWFRVDRAVLREASAVGTPASQLVLDQLTRDPQVDPAALRRVLPDPGTHALLPAHPWQARHLQGRAELRELFRSGAVVDVGELGGRFRPTTSVRSVHRDGWDWMLKFSLDVRLTNSKRVTLTKELGRAVESANMYRGPIGDRAATVAPAFVPLLDPAHLAVEWDGSVVEGLSVLLRENRWPSSEGADVTALTTLCQDRPGGGPSRLAAIVTDLSDRLDRPRSDVGREWFGRFLDVVVASLVRLYLDVGLCFEAHQQNTLVELEDGWPVRCVYRDSQGYFHREAAHADLCEVMAGLGEVTESIFPEDLADERLAYYLFVNMAFGVVNALGVGGCADETVLLGDLRRLLEDLRHAPHRYPATLLDGLLDQERLPCKGNLRTRVHDMDELVGDIATQSVYVTIPNPLAVAGR